MKLIEAIKEVIIKTEEGNNGSYFYAFGNKTRPRPPRWDRDLHLKSKDDMVQPSPKLGASVFGNVNFAPLTGHFHKIPKTIPMPQGLAIIADGIDVGGQHPSTHHTIYATECMPYDEFSMKFLSLPWTYAGKKKR